MIFLSYDPELYYSDQ